MDNAKSKKNLIALLHFVRDCELDKPFEECNHEVVEACIKLLLKLQGKVVTFTTEQIEDKVRKMPFIFTLDTENEHKRNVRKYSTKKILLIAAIIALLCAILAVFSIGHNMEYWHSVMDDKFGSVLNIPVDQIFSIGEKEFVNTGASVFYDNTDDFRKKENFNVLLPSNLPDNISLRRIQISEAEDIIYLSFDNVITSYEININTKLQKELLVNSDSYTTDNGLLCYIFKINNTDIVQIYFEYNGNTYTIGGTNKQTLLDIINNLEESE